MRTHNTSNHKSYIQSHAETTDSAKCMKLAWSLKYGVWYPVYFVVVKYSKVTVMVGQNRYSKLRIPSQLHTRNSAYRFPHDVMVYISSMISIQTCEGTQNISYNL